MFKNFFLAVPFVLISLLAPDAGGSGGGGGTPAPKADSPPPEPEGNTLEDKLAHAKTLIASFFKDAARLTGELAAKTNDHRKLEQQFNDLQTTAQGEKDAHIATKGLLETEKAAHTKTSTELVAAQNNVSRLEKICDLKGIDKNQVIPAAPPAPTGDQTREALVNKLNAEKDPVKRNEIANELREFDRKAKEKKSKLT
jgi:hypothetical protein